MNLKDVKELINSTVDSGILEFKLNLDEAKIVVKRNIKDKEMKMIPSVISQNTMVSQVDKSLIEPYVIERRNIAVNDDSKHCIIRSPFIGTLSLQSRLGESRFIKIGEIIKQKDVLCIIEGLKLLNEVRSDVSGKIIQILVKNSTPVEYNQPLFVIAK